MSTETSTLPVTRQAIAARDRSRPGKITGRLRNAIGAMVWEGASRKEAAEKAGLADHSLREALKKPHVLRHYLGECEVLRVSGRARRILRLDELSEQNENKAAAVQAIRAAEGLADVDATNHAMRPRQAGVTIIIGNQPGPRPAVTVDDRPLIDVTSDPAPDV